MKQRNWFGVVYGAIALICFGMAVMYAVQGCKSASVPATQPSINWAQLENDVQVAATAYAVISPFLPAGSEKTTGDTAYAVAEATLAKIAADRAAGKLTPNQADLTALTPLAAQLQPLIAKATVNKALTAPSVPTPVPPVPPVPAPVK